MCCDQRCAANGMTQSEWVKAGTQVLERDGGGGHLPDCRGHRRAVPCSPTRSARSCPPRRTVGAPGAARGRGGRPAGGDKTITS